MKQGKASGAYMALVTMGQKVTGKTAYSLFKLKTEIEKVVQFQEGEKDKLIKKYGGVIMDNGMVRIDDPAKMKQFVQEVHNLFDLECDIKPIELKIDDVPDITLKEIDSLNGFVTFIE